MRTDQRRYQIRSTPEKTDWGESWNLRNQISNIHVIESQKEKKAESRVERVFKEIVALIPPPYVSRK